MRMRSRRVEVSSELQITSMMDMFTIILVFLLTFFDPNQADTPTLSLAQVDAAGEETPGLRLDVRQDAITLEGKRLLTLEAGTLSDATRDGRVLLALRDALQGYDPEGGVVIAVDKAVPYSTVADVLSSCTAAGFTQYRFAVESTR